MNAILIIVKVLVSILIYKICKILIKNIIKYFKEKRYWKAIFRIWAVAYFIYSLYRFLSIL